MKDNRGFTLVELIVVMLIMAVLATGSVAGYNLLHVGSAKRASERILSVLSEVQMENLAKNEAYSLVITQNSQGDYVLSVSCDGSSVSSEVLNMRNGRISFETGAGSTIEVGPSAKLEVCFRKDTGGVKKNGEGEIITRIRITSNGDTFYIRMVTATGKHFIE